jgi:hypothetical protein
MAVAANAFLLSRIYGQGWNMARKLLATGDMVVDQAREATLNPYRAGAERERWAMGFNEALASPAKSCTRPGGNAWRRTSQE